ncbi:MAG TPA: type II CAAX endopeptidase family protein [Anaerolineales bacterium]|nr:type II CAAX endopeptidase family protein [Anaerolineales bacterium]
MSEALSRSWKQSLVTMAIFVVCGGTIGAAGYVSFLPQEARTVLKVTAAVATLAAWLLLRRRERLHLYRPILLGFFSVSIGLLLAQFFGTIPLRLLGWSVSSARGIAVAKLGESLAIVLSILVTHFAAGGNRDALFLGGGHLKLGLTAGVLGFAAFAAIAAVQAIGSGLSWAAVAAALPWIAIFVFSNAFMEELWFRALFLKKLEPLVGAGPALVSTSLVFALVHISSTYVIDIVLFLVALMALGLLWGWLMRKSDSIWGSVLIHAGADVLVMIGFLAGGGL